MACRIQIGSHQVEALFEALIYQGDRLGWMTQEYIGCLEPLNLHGLPHQFSLSSTLAPGMTAALDAYKPLMHLVGLLLRRSPGVA